MSGIPGSIPAAFEIVLLGVGHTNAHLLRQWRMRPLPGARLTCLSNFPLAAYSGMLPGVLAGRYPPAAMEIDLVRFCASAGARLLLEEATGIDIERRLVLLAGRPPLPFDALVIGAGSVPSRTGLQAEDELLLPIKPMQNFVERLTKRVMSLLQNSPGSPLRVSIVGGGAGGVEIAFCLPALIRRLAPQAQLQLTLIDAHERILPGASARTAKWVLKQLERRGVGVVTGRRVVRATGAELELDQGEKIPADLCLWAAGAVAPPLFARFDLPRDARGFLLTAATLQTSDPRQPPIFAVGDSGTIQGENLPKAGVYAVRQGPILWENLQRLQRGEPLLPYQPQRRFLKLLNLGDGAALGEYSGWPFQGRWVMRWKDRIDRNFMAMYQNYQPPMPAENRPPRGAQPAEPMRCLGCGGKIAADVLRRALDRVNSDLLAQGGEPLAADDAALVPLTAHSGQPPSVAVTTDFFTAPLEDAWLSGRIAALHAASDLLAKGAQPVAAVALATLPAGPDARQEQTLYELLAGGVRELTALNCRLVGGHTIAGDALTIGFTLLGEPGPRWLAKSGVRPGDALVLTKPLGTGVLLAALRQAQLPARFYEPLLQTLLQSNLPASEMLLRHGATAATDVTGFGLIGHLLEMLEPAGCDAQLVLGAIPFLPGALELTAQGVVSTLVPANRRRIAQLEFPEADRSRPEFGLLFDPQTSGGLLAALPGERAEEYVRALVEIGQTAAVIGSVSERQERQSRVRFS